MHFVGASIIAGLLFFILNLGSSLLLDAANVTTVGAIFEALIKTAVFVTLFHYLHNWTASLLGWYRTDKPDDPHRFDRNPALDAARLENKTPVSGE